MAPFVELCILLLICALALGWDGFFAACGICAIYFGVLWIFSKES